MPLNNPSAIERDNQNSLRKFPFSDSASCTNGACVITPDAIIDAQLYIPGRTPGRVWMSAIDADGKLHFSDDGGEFAETAASATPNAAVPVTFTGDGGPVNGGTVVFGTAQAVSTLRAYGGQEFDDTQTELAPAAVTFTGAKRVLGFLLDDGNTVFGDVKIRGENGCSVSTYVGADERSYLQISAIGSTVETVVTAGFIKTVIADSDNTNFTVSKARSQYVLDIRTAGVSTTQDAGINADQDDVCAVVKKARGTLPSTSATAPEGCGDPCEETSTVPHLITFKDGSDTVGTPITVYTGQALGDLEEVNIPTAGTKHAGKRFTGYFDKPETDPIRSDAKLYYRYDGSSTGTFDATSDVTLYAYWVPATSRAEMSFDGYGTLHIAAPDDTNYTNPIKISSVKDPVPVVREVDDDVLVKGGSDALAEIVLHPTVPNGTVTIGIRGLNKAYSS